MLGSVLDRRAARVPASAQGRRGIAIRAAQANGRGLPGSGPQQERQAAPSSPLSPRERGHPSMQQVNAVAERLRLLEAVAIDRSTDDETRRPVDIVDYAKIDSEPLNQLVMQLFRNKMVAALGDDTEKEGYAGIIDLTRKLNYKFMPRQTQQTTVKILQSLFPAWLLPLFKVMFAKPFPGFSNQMNAFATALTCQWLMGPCKVNDVELPSGQVLPASGVKIDRCRYLEESGCISVCLNSCKVPTQEFFKNDMGVDVTLTPNYEDFSCQFAFGVVAGPQSTDDAFKSPCYAQCPSKRKRLDTPECTGSSPADLKA